MNTIRNHITLIGNIGNDPFITTFENGSKVARFNLATDYNYRANSGKIKSSTNWHRIFAWGNLAEFIQNYGAKGKKVAIHGRLVDRTVKSKDGVIKHVKEVEVHHIIGL